jgi:hypothetical protein
MEWIARNVWPNASPLAESWTAARFENPASLQGKLPHRITAGFTQFTPGKKLVDPVILVVEAILPAG